MGRRGLSNSIKVGGEPQSLALHEALREYGRSKQRLSKLKGAKNCWGKNECLFVFCTNSDVVLKAEGGCWAFYEYEDRSP